MKINEVYSLLSFVKSQMLEEDFDKCRANVESAITSFYKLKRKLLEGC
jgi:hypothetical protein